MIGALPRALAIASTSAPKLDGIGITEVLEVVGGARFEDLDNSVVGVRDESIVVRVVPSPYVSTGSPRSINCVNLATARSRRFLGP